MKKESSVHLFFTVYLPPRNGFYYAVASYNEDGEPACWVSRTVILTKKDEELLPLKSVVGYQLFSCCDLTPSSLSRKKKNKT